MSGRTALVVGAGIGGLAAACALARAGWRVTVYEQARVLREVGAGLSIAPNAVRALEWLGFGPELRAKAQGQGIGVKTRSGRWMVRLTGADLEQRYGNPMFAMHRADLHRMLLDGAGSVTVHTGHQAIGVTTGPTGAQVGFTSDRGPVTAAADLVVAADGVHSRIRAALFPQHPGAAYAGYVCWRGIAPADIGRRLAQPPVWTDTWGRGVRFGTAMLADGRVFWYGSVAGPEGAFAGDTPADIAARFRHWHSPVPDIPLTATPDTLLRNDIYFVRVPLPSFVHGRVVLLGDAAHAVTPDIGQGACLAIEDAVVLDAVTRIDSDLDVALRAYDDTRRPRTQRLARISGNSARVQQARHPITAGLRDLMVSLLPKRAYLDAGADALAWTPPETEAAHAP